MNPVRLGEFEVLSPIGKGGMAEVWRGVHRSQQVEVAIKVITPSQAREPEQLMALRNEVRAVARLDHPGIVMLFDYGEVPEHAEASSNGLFTANSPYLVMEYASLGSLDMVRKPLPWPDLRHILYHILDALAHAHARGVIHLDLKPANVLMAGAHDSRPGLKLTDFGIAYALEEHTDLATTGSPAGTPYYMAPEQLQGHWRDYGPWTDLYALGCMAYELSTSRVPFAERDYLRLALAHLRETPTDMPRREGYPDRFSDWVFRLLQKDPGNRFQRAADAAWALMRLDGSAGRDDSTRLALEVDLTSPAEDEPVTPVEVPTTGWLSLPPSDPKLAWPEDRTLEDLPTAAQLDAAGSLTENLCEPPRPPRPLQKDWPSCWQRPAGMSTSFQLVGVGLSLYGLRPIPFVNRDTERQAIWDHLTQVHRTGLVHVLLFRGAAGVGKSRLAEWMCDRASELGAAIVLKASHGPIAGPADGLPRMVSRHLGCVGLGRTKALERIQSILQRQGVGDQYEWNALTELVLPTPEQPSGQGPPVRFTQPSERYALVTRLLQRIGSERPVILWLDDVQWGADGLSFIQYLVDMRNIQPTPVLVLLTAQEEALADRPLEAGLLTRLASCPQVRFDSLGPLKPGDRPFLVRNLLGLEPELAHRIEDRTGGNPLFAVELVGDWVRRGVLEVGRDGFVLRPGERAVLPDDIHTVWRTRIERFLQEYLRRWHLSGKAISRDDVERTLELAAALGQEVDAAEWKDACAASNLPCPPELWECLVSTRLANTSESGWAFVHGMLRESLERRSRELERWTGHNRTCAAMLRQRYPSGSHGIAERLGQHLIEAREYESAIEPLLAGATQRWKQSDFKQALALLVLHDQALDTLGLEPEDPRRCQGWLCRSRILVHQTDFQGARFWAERCEAAARRIGARDLVARSLLLIGTTFLWRGPYHQAIDHYQQALDLFRELEDGHSVAQTLNNLGHAFRQTGNLTEAQRCFQEARDLFDLSGDRDAAMNSALGLAGVALEQQDLERAIALAEQALGHFTRSGDRYTLVNCHNQLGEAFRLKGDLDAAEEHYQNAIVLYASLGIALGSIIPRLNLNYIRLARGEFTTARASLEAIARTCREQGWHSLAGLALCPLLASVSATRDWSAWDDLFDQARAGLGETGAAERDPAWTLMLAGDLALQAGESRRARQAYTLALEIWEKLGCEDQVASSRAALSRCPGT